VPLGAVTRGSEASKLLVQSVTGCVLMLTVSGPATVRAEAKEPQAAVDAQTGIAKFTFPVQNTGEIHVKCNGQAVVFGPDGRVAARLPLDVGTGTILPGGIRSLTASWRLPKSPEPGEYRVQGRVSVPGSRSLRAQCTFRLP